MLFELPDEMQSPKTTFWGPFLLGLTACWILIFVPSFATIYQYCDEALTNFECPSINEEEPVIMPLKKQSFLKKLFRRKPKNAGGDQAGSTTPGSLKELVFLDPGISACHLFWTGLERLGWQTSHPQTYDECVVQSRRDTSSDDVLIDPQLLEEYKTGYTSEFLSIPSQRASLIQALLERSKTTIPNFEERSKAVKWGGPQSKAEWFQPQVQSAGTRSDLEALDGGNLFYSYLRIMDWPADFRTHFPFKLCSKGCDPEFAIEHTLEFREKYKPWLVNPGLKGENSRGSVYVHGFSPPVDGENGSHSIVWIRPGLRTRTGDDISYTRAFVQTLDKAVASSMEHSQGRVGKFNVVVDGSEFSWKLVPSLHDTKLFVTMLQDHFPDRLGIVLMSNLGRIGEFVVNLFMPLITEEVRNKLKVLPRDPDERRQVLEAVLGKENVPDWMGGSDTWRFKVDEYYDDPNVFATDAETKEYLTTMPYHS